MLAIKPRTIEIELPDELSSLELPACVHGHLQQLLDKQGEGIALSSEEREQAAGPLNLSEALFLLRLRAHRLG